MLIKSEGLVPHMIASLMLDPNHKRLDPKQNTSQATKNRVQRDYAECIQQISLYPPGCEVLKANPAVVEALDALIDKAWTEEAQQCAHAIMMQLCPERIKHSAHTGGGSGTQAEEGHVMISYQWVGVHRQHRVSRQMM